MAIKNDDKVVSEIYETNDYNKFSVLAENRGQKETKGIKERKLNKLQRIINKGDWIHEVSRVCINESFQIVDGAHTLEICKRNGLPVRYEIIRDPAFNEVTRRDMIAAVYTTNSINTTWQSGELFGAAVQTKAPLALILYEIIEAHDNYFIWTDLLALLEKDGRYFTGFWREHANMKTFERKDLIEVARSPEFALEVKEFAKINLKARIAHRKGVILKAAYEILWHCRDMVNPSAFRKSLASIPENAITSAKLQTTESAGRMLIHHYNKSQGKATEVAAVIFAIKHKSDAEVIEL